MQEDHLSLFELNNLIKGTIKQSLPSAYWIVAEISELKVNISGHCYLELVEKDAGSQALKAKARATIWSSAYRMIQPYFETTAKAKLAAGIKVLVKVTVEFHELYGLSLNITDIEPSYTLGDLARQKQEVIDRLVREGVFDLNRQLPFPRLPGKIAVISSETAAGYGDFTDQLLHNDYGYVFYVKLFPAVMQGDEAETSIIHAMEKVFRHEDFFDTLVIIRGGGSQSDLSCFNSYWMASHIAQFSLPVLTGIGHEQDETVADMVAHTRLKTPTAVAEFLLARYQDEESLQHELSSSLTDASRSILNAEANRLMKLAFTIKPLMQSLVENNRKKLAIASVMIKNASQKMLSAALNRSSMIQFRMGSASGHFLLRQQHLIVMVKNRLENTLPPFYRQQLHRLEMLDHKIHYNDPQTILKRGYSITLLHGKPVRNAAEVKEGEIIDTVLHRGRIRSEVKGEEVNSEKLKVKSEIFENKDHG